MGTAEGVTDYIHADLRDPERIIAEAARTLDLSKPVALTLLAIVEFIPEEAQPYAIVDRITADVAQPLSAADLASEMGMSESRFSRFFRKTTGNTFTDFVNRVRVNRACQLLMETERRVTQICYDVGFNNVANFNRRFLEIKGMTPTEFRRRAEARFGGRA